ncbi:MAG: protein phosphatase 2C domain-containing protein [Acidobacteria bacterium]|nr:protein phosphatase 2C domain-containing protein [Acidobacteriota bacterium]
MAVITRLRCAGLSDKGRVRGNNEDRIFWDVERGIFLVIDGMGGHAAGEKAAEIARDLIVRRLLRQTGTVEERIREAIALASNEIHDLAQSNTGWKGMACVLTLAMLSDNGEVVAGHVGDSRLYLLRPGAMQKATHDHSPVGELEDAGDLSEAEAMRHPRRNEVYRDVGSERHAPDDLEFIEIVRLQFASDELLLLCTDGLSDQVPSRQIRRIIEEHAGTPDRAARALIAAANEAGGKDNVSVLLVEGPAYASAVRPADAPPADYAEAAANSGWIFTGRAAFLLYGILAALLIIALSKPYWQQTESGGRLRFGSVRPPLHWTVGPAPGSHLATIGEALARALPGDTVVVAPGTYAENVTLRSGVSLISRERHRATIAAAGPVVAARKVEAARLVGFRITSTGANIAEVGLLIEDSSLEASDLEITSVRTGVLIRGASLPVLRASRVLDNLGPGILVADSARPQLVHNLIARNGRDKAQVSPGVEVTGSSQPFLGGNTIVESGAEEIWVSPLFDPADLLRQNVVGLPNAPARRRVRVIAAK